MLLYILLRLLVCAERRRRRKAIGSPESVWWEGSNIHWGHTGILSVRRKLVGEGRSIGVGIGQLMIGPNALIGRIIGMNCRLFLWGRSGRKTGDWRQRLLRLGVRYRTGLNWLSCGRSSVALSYGGGFNKIV